MRVTDLKYVRVRRRVVTRRHGWCNLRLFVESELTFSVWEMVIEARPETEWTALDSVGEEESVIDENGAGGRE